MLSPSNRKFESRPAVRASVPLFVWLFGPSGSGKTFSALRLATGMQRVAGGDIYFIDSEANRALHYADRFKFHHVPFEAPFGPLDYMDAIRYCIHKGAKTIVTDSFSHMHEGPGGTLESHAQELDRIAGDDWGKRNRSTMLAWQRPKSELRKFLNDLTQKQINLVGCFRAKEKVKLIKGKDPEPLGLMPIAGDEMIYEGTVSCLLHPGAGGVPSWHPDELGEKAIIKLPEQFRSLFSERKPLDEDIGEALARWASGEAMKPAAVDRAQALVELSQALEARGFSDPSSRLEWVSGQLRRPVNAPKEIKPAELPGLVQAAKKIGEGVIA